MSETQTPTTQDSRAVIIIEDEASVSRMYARLAKRLSLSTRSYASLDDLAEASVVEDEVLVLLDIALINGDAFDALRVLQHWTAKVRVVLISGQDANILRSTRLFAEEIGLSVVCVIQKPDVTERLRLVLEEYVQAPAHGSQHDTPTSLTHAAYSPGAIVDDEFQHSERPEASRYISALKANEFVPWFQPIVDLEQGRVTSVEALVRWNHPEEGVLAPARFLGDIDRLGLMPELTYTVLEQSLIAATRWTKSYPGVSVAVNLQASLVASADLSDRVQSALERHRLSPSTLTLEITERQELLDVGVSLESLSRLRMLGVGVAMDDFGRGFSGFDGVRRLPLTRLKIDRDLMVAAVADSSIRQVVQALSRLAVDTGIDTVAEGIETETMARLSSNLGINMGQGFLWSPPVPAEQLVAVIARIEQGFSGYGYAENLQTDGVSRGAMSKPWL